MTTDIRYLQWLVQDATQRIRVAREQNPSTAATALERQGLTVARHAWIWLSLASNPDPKHFHQMPENDEQLEAWLFDTEKKFNKETTPRLNVHYR